MSDVTPVIQQVAFRPEGIVEITYAEPHEQSDSAAMVRVIWFQADQAGQLLVEVEDALLDLLDEMVRQLRAPEQKRPAR